LSPLLRFAVADACGAGILLPGEQWKKLHESLSVREHRLVNMEGALKKRRVSTLKSPDS
jgi:hypothetical protein